MFKDPESGNEHDGDEHSSSMGAPLLAGRRRTGTDDEIEDLILAEGPVSAGRGSLLDGIANVSVQIEHASLAVVLTQVDGEFHHWRRHCRVSSLA